MTPLPHNVGAVHLDAPLLTSVWYTHTHTSVPHHIPSASVAPVHDDVRWRRLVFPGGFPGPRGTLCVPAQSASHVVCASPQYVDQQWDVNPRPSARELLDKDVKKQDSQTNKLAKT